VKLYHDDALREITTLRDKLIAMDRGRDLVFAADLDHTVAKILEHPMQRPLIDETRRAWRLDLFDYRVVYRVHASGVRILALEHLHDRPGSWQHRK
jgi:mRNA-degrading endonuclease RelE of RelBE toxin-antitoxin system